MIIISSGERLLIEKIKEGINEFDTLLDTTNWEFSKLSELLTKLEIKGVLLREGGKFIAGI